MAIALSGLMSPPQEETYVWFFDPAVDREKSNFLDWIEDGRSGVVPFDGQVPATFRWAPLDPDQRDVVLRLQSASVVRTPNPVPLTQDDEAFAAWSKMVSVFEGLGVRETVAYGLRGIDGLDVPFQRHPTPAGHRVSDSILRALRHPTFTCRANVRIQVPEENETTPEMEFVDGVRYVSQVITVRLMDDLGSRIWRASNATVIEKKV